MSLNIYVHNFETMKPRLGISEGCNYIGFSSGLVTDSSGSAKEDFVLYFDCEHHARQMFAMLEKWRVVPAEKPDVPF